MLKQKEKILSLEKLKERQKNKFNQMAKRKVIKKADSVQDVPYQSRNSDIEARIIERQKYFESLLKPKKKQSKKDEKQSKTLSMWKHTRSSMKL